VHYRDSSRTRSTAGAAADEPRFGGMISATLRTDLAGTRRFLEAVRIFALAESLAASRAWSSTRAIMTHATIPAETRQKLGIAMRWCVFGRDRDVDESARRICSRRWRGLTDGPRGASVLRQRGRFEGRSAGPAARSRRR